MTNLNPETADEDSNEQRGSLRLVWVIVVGFMLNLITGGINQRRAQLKHEEILGKMEEVRQELKTLSPAQRKH